jgi:hypothetical protein
MDLLSMASFFYPYLTTAMTVHVLNLVFSVMQGNLGVLPVNQDLGEKGH